MPKINKDKCFALQPKSLILAIPENLRADWLSDFYQLLAAHLKLNNTEKHL